MTPERSALIAEIKAKRRADYMLKTFGIVEPGAKTIFMKPVIVPAKSTKTRAELFQERQRDQLKKTIALQKARRERERVAKQSQNAVVDSAKRFHDLKVEGLQAEAAEKKRVLEAKKKVARELRVEKRALNTVVSIAKKEQISILKPKGEIRRWYGFTGVN